MPKQNYLHEIPWPFKGLDEGRAFHGQSHGTCVDARNVVSYDPRTGRSRGAQRAGLSKYLSAQCGGGANKIQDLNYLVSVEDPSTLSATTLSIRSTKRLVACGGDIHTFNGGSFSDPTGYSGVLDANAPVVFSAPLFGVMYYTDGLSYVKYTNSTDTVATWAASSGTLPANGSYRPRLIVMWRGRMVLSGLYGDEHNWFMSRQDDADDWDYAPATVTEQDPIAGNNSEAGLIGDIVNTMIPYSDDQLIFGCDHSIWQMSGDPMAGGRIDNLSDTIGMAWGQPWCRDAVGQIYFFGSRGGVYRMVPGSPPVRLTSMVVDERLSTVDLSDRIIRMAWDDRTQGVHLFITPLDGTTATTHFYYDVRNEAWWPVVYAAAAMNPRCVLLFDGDTAADRTILLGGTDGYVRKIDLTAKDDDGTAIDSHVWLGPIKAPQQNRMRLKEMQAVIASGASDVTFAVHADESEEAAFASTAKFTGTWSAGRNRSERRRAIGHALYIKLSNNTVNQTWAFESLLAGLQSTGAKFQRRF